MIEVFKKHPRWDRATVEKAARKSGLSRSQVYKWGWDQKKRHDPEDLDFDIPIKDEFGGYSKHNFVENDKSSILKLLNINLNEKVKNLLEDIESKESSRSLVSKVKSELNSNLVDTRRKREKKDLRKRNRISSQADEFTATPLTKSKKKNFETVTRKSISKVKKRLFKESEDKKEVTDENKPTPSSSNSVLKNSGSRINTSDMK